MDDPWGSPWADDAQLDHPIKTKESHEATLKTQTPAKAATLALEGKTNSPWDDDTDDAGDDGFGEWSSMPTKEGGGGLRFDGTDEGWHQNAGDHEGLPEPHSRELSPIWKANVAVSSTPKLAPSPMPKQSMRQPSPDPWATEFTLNDAESKEITRREHQGFEKIVSESPLAGSDRNVSPAGDVSLPIIDLQPDLQDITPKENTASVEVNGAEDHETGPGLVTTEQRPNIPDIDPLSSRPSSSPSDGSQHDDGHESPRTSMDEDPKRPQLPRKVSSKVQELVQHFDGLARQEDGVHSRTESRTGEDGSEGSEDGIDDFGDFEEGHSDVEEEIERETGRQESPAIADPAPAEDTEPQTPKASSVEQEHPSPDRTPKKFYGPVEIDIDLSILNSLYPRVETGYSEEKIFIPDTVPQDSFSSMEQRKTWYRISRYGTMLKHNTGDDENYVRVNWQKSQIRDDTLKIVARWMEEDRMSGQVVLGGGSKTSSIFGWNDSKAPPVPLSSAFAPKHSKKKPEPTPMNASEIPREWPTVVKTHSSSKNRSPLSSRRRSSAKSLHGPEEIKLSPVPPAPDFGWNSALGSKNKSSAQMPLSLSHTSGSIPKDVSPITKLHSPTHQPNSSIRPMSIPETIKPVESPQQTPVSAFDNHNSGLPPFEKPQSQTVSVSNGTNNQNNDDDDWGDMVSSPSVTSLPVLSPSKGLRHKKSQSLMSAFPSTIDASAVSEAQKALTPSASGHRSTMSFNEILVPQNRSSITSTTTTLDMNPFVIPATISLPNGKVHGSVAAIPPTIPRSNDPWASADFSFFDNSPAPPPKLASAPTSKTAVPKSVSFSNTDGVPPPRPNQKAGEKMEQDRVVQNIIKSLPDLSYMLRR